MADRLIEMRAVADMPGTSIRIASEDLRAIVARIDAQAAEIERLQHQADQADQIDVRSIVDALSWMGVSTPDGGTEAAAARLGRLVNDLSAAVLRHKIDHRNKCEEIKRMRGALLWTLWRSEGGSSTIGQPLRRVLGIRQFEALTPEQIECAKRFGEQQ